MKILTWNMAGAGFHTAAPHAAAWDWLLTEAKFDAALLQEAIPPAGLSEQFATVLLRPRVSSRWRCWGNCILVRDHVYVDEVFDNGKSWANISVLAMQIAHPHDSLPLLVNIHSSDRHIDGFPREEFVNNGGLTCHRSKVWEIEVAAHLARPILMGRRFVLGGDLNAALLLDEVRRHKNNARLWANLENQGFHDLRPRHHEREQQTFFRSHQKTHQYQLDHFFGDAETRARTRSWTVITEVARDRHLSDHAPVLIEID
jgi:hypothetical protein